MYGIVRVYFPLYVRHSCTPRLFNSVSKHIRTHSLYYLFGTVSNTTAAKTMLYERRCVRRSRRFVFLIWLAWVTGVSGNVRTLFSEQFCRGHIRCDCRLPPVQIMEEFCLSYTMKKMHI